MKEIHSAINQKDKIVLSHEQYNNLVTVYNLVCLFRKITVTCQIIMSTSQICMSTLQVNMSSCRLVRNKI